MLFKKLQGNIPLCNDEAQVCLGRDEQSLPESFVLGQIYLWERILAK